MAVYIRYNHNIMLPFSYSWSLFLYVTGARISIYGSWLNYELWCWRLFSTININDGVITSFKWLSIALNALHTLLSPHQSLGEV